MPLDGSTYLTDWQLKQLADLARLDAWFCDESRWCQHTLSRYDLRTAREQACLIGGIAMAKCRLSIRTEMLLCSAAGRPAAEFNDDPRTTFADIKSVIQRAREAVLSGAA
jgi:hypothetical protein